MICSINDTLVNSIYFSYFYNNGEFKTFNYGSNTEEYATKLAVEEYEILQKECLENIKNNISSPIEYFMYKNTLDDVIKTKKKDQK